ncbi:unnamed protein product [Owenia fusiformis]|uniref:Uncharacterized protein n=1 Tax=Owenia fusiformis TaxID=6347 RepID=A0A8J1XF42_OWEFU|nr:unnamed protein product [Owenia fusiformis]
MRLLLLLAIAVTLVTGIRRPRTASSSDSDTTDERVQILWDTYKKYEDKGTFKTGDLPNKSSCGPSDINLHIHAEDDHHNDDEHDHIAEHDHQEAHVHLHVKVEPSKMMQKMMIKHRYEMDEDQAAYGVCFMIPNAVGTRAGQVIGMIMLKQQRNKDTEMRVMLRGLDTENAADNADHMRKLFLHEAGIVALGACENVGKVVKLSNRGHHHYHHHDSHEDMETDMKDGNVGSFTCDAMGNVNTNLTAGALALFGDSSAFGRTIVIQEHDGSIPACCVVFRTTSDYWTGKKQFPRRQAQPTF